MGPEGFEPPPTGLKGRHAAATPRPRAGHYLPGYSFDPDHRISPRYELCQGIRAAGFEPAVSSSRSLRISQPLPRPGHSCEQPVWESNPPLRLERAVSLADRRTGQRPGVGRGALESPSAGIQPAARPSQLPTHSAVPTKRPGVLVTPGLRLRARDVRGRASRPQGIEPERARRRIGGSLRFLATQGVTRTPGEHGRPQCKGYLRPTRLGADLTARPSSCTLTDASPQEDVRAISRIGGKQAVGRISSDPILDALQPSVFPSVIACGMGNFLRSLHLENPIKQGVSLAGVVLTPWKSQVRIPRRPFDIR